MFELKTMTQSRNNPATDACPLKTGRTARLVCSVNSSERPRITKMKPNEYMFAISSVTTGFGSSSCTNVCITAIRNRLNPISSPADNPEKNKRPDFRSNAASASFNS
jgi:hypothetical protein